MKYKRPEFSISECRRIDDSTSIDLNQIPNHIYEYLDFKLSNTNRSYDRTWTVGALCLDDAITIIKLLLIERECISKSLDSAEEYAYDTYKSNIQMNADIHSKMNEIINLNADLAHAKDCLLDKSNELANLLNAVDRYSAIHYNRGLEEGLSIDIPSIISKQDIPF